MTWISMRYRPNSDLQSICVLSYAQLCLWSERSGRGGCDFCRWVLPNKERGFPCHGSMPLSRCDLHAAVTSPVIAEVIVSISKLVPVHKMYSGGVRTWYSWIVYLVRCTMEWEPCTVPYPEQNILISNKNFISKTEMKGNSPSFRPHIVPKIRCLNGSVSKIITTLPILAQFSPSLDLSKAETFVYLKIKQCTHHQSPFTKFVEGGNQFAWGQPVVINEHPREAKFAKYDVNFFGFNFVLFFIFSSSGQPPGLVIQHGCNQNLHVPKM